MPHKRLLPPLYPVTPEDIAGHALADWTATLLSLGCRLMQFRRKSGSDEEKLQDIRTMVALVRRAGGLVTVDDRLDLALLAGADGVHLGQDDIPVPEARRLLGPGKLIGFSTHNLAQFEAALEYPADYLSLGPVYPTRTKERPDPVVPLDVQSVILKRSTQPVVAIGGVRPENAGELYRRGFASLAAISAFEGNPSESWQAFKRHFP